MRGQGDRPGGEVVGIASDRLFGWTFHLNGGGIVEPGDDQPGVIWGIIVERPLVGSLRAVAEVDGESVREREAQNSALVGAILDVEVPPPFHGLSLDVGVRHGISSSADDWGGTAGFTVAFPW